MKWDTTIIAILAVSFLVSFSALLGHDGIILTAGIGAIAALAGIKTGHIK